MRYSFKAFLALVVGMTAGCSGGGGGGAYDSGTGYGTTAPTAPTAPAANQVIATAGSAFNPSSLTVSRGTTVTFTFESVGHNVFFDAVAGAPADIPAVTTNTSVTRTFSTSGTFGYTCHVHAFMRGTIVVQ